MNARLDFCPAQRLHFSLDAEVTTGAFCQAGQLLTRFAGREETVLQAAELRLVGRHNLGGMLGYRREHEYY